MEFEVSFGSLRELALSGIIFRNGQVFITAARVPQQGRNFATNGICWFAARIVIMFGNRVIQRVWFYWESNERKRCPSGRELGVTANEKENAMR
ncbi:MAG TPA: hypothetical protein VF772_11605 [Terriglobales bacterium]